MIVLWKIYERECGCGLNQITHSKRPAQKYINPEYCYTKHWVVKGPVEPMRSKWSWESPTRAWLPWKKYCHS